MKIPALFTLIIISGCAVTYAPPVSLSASSTQRFALPRAVIFNAAKRALVVDGYQITNADENSGIISTAPRDMRVSPDIADCGTTLGLDYLKDNRTSTHVAMGVVVYNNEMEIKANIQGNYLPSSTDQGITLTCVSKGKLESDMTHKVLAEANRQ